MPESCVAGIIACDTSAPMRIPIDGIYTSIGNMASVPSTKEKELIPVEVRIEVLSGLSA